MFSSRIRKVVISSLAAVLLLMQSAPVFAQNGGNGLSISPTKTELNIARGKAEVVSIQVKNLTKGKIIAKAYLNDFEADADTGNPKLIVDRTSEASSSSLASFILGLDDLTLEAGETKELTLTVQVPEKAISGAYFGAIRFTSTPAEQNKNEAQVSLNASVASIILVEVPGEITEKIEVKKVSAILDGKFGSFFLKKPNQIGVTVKNLGNGFAKPFGKVLLTNMYGKMVNSYELNDTVPRGNVLPGTIRNFKNDVKGIHWPGRYTIEADVSSGKGEILQVRSSFWFLPVWFIILVAVLLLLIVGAAYYMYRRYMSRSISRRK